MKRTAIAVSVCFGIAPSAAFALDWSIKTTESETVELNSNQFLKPSPAGSVGSYSTITANAQALTSASKFDFDADGTFRKYWGPGVNGLPSEALSYGFKAHYEVNEKTKPDREYVETSWRQQSTSLAILNDLGVTTPVGGFLDTLTATGGIDRTLSSRDNVNLFATSTRTSYEPSSGGIPFTDTQVQATWKHKVSAIAALTASSQVELLAFDNSTNTRVQIYRNQAGVEATLSPVLSFRGNVGVAYLETQGAVGITTLIGGSGSGGSSAVADWIGDAVLTYRVLKNTTFTLNASQTIGPSVVGSLFKRDSVIAGLTHTISSSSMLSFSAGWNRQISTTTTDYASASVTYSYNFIRDWSAQLTYRYQHRFASTGGTTTIDAITGTPTVSGTGPADSNSIMLVVTNSYTILPRGN